VKDVSLRNKSNLSRKKSKKFSESGEIFHANGLT